MRSLTLSVLALLGLAIVVQANPIPIRPVPRPAGGREVKFVVEIDPDATTPRLVVPKGLMAPAPAPGKGLGLSALPTIVIGLSLALALGSGGVWLARRGKGKIVAGLFVFALIAGSSSLYADLAIGPRPKPLTPVKLPANVTLPDKVMIEFAGAGDTIKLIVPKKAVKAAPAKAVDKE